MSRQDLEYFSGDSIRLPIVFDSNGTAIDIRTWNVWLTVKSDIGSNDDAADYQDTADLTDGLTGIAVFTITHEETKILLGHYWYDIKYIDSDGNVQTALFGKLIFKKSVFVNLGDDVSASASPSHSPSSSPSSSPSPSNSPSSSPSASLSTSSSPSA